MLLRINGASFLCYPGELYIFYLPCGARQVIQSQCQLFFCQRSVQALDTNIKWQLGCLLTSLATVGLEHGTFNFPDTLLNQLSCCRLAWQSVFPLFVSISVHDLVTNKPLRHRNKWFSKRSASFLASGAIYIYHALYWTVYGAPNNIQSKRYKFILILQTFLQKLENWPSVEPVY